MRQFFMIDPWLGDAKGHNYQFALDVAGAAEQAGFCPVLGIRHDRVSRDQFPASWQIEPVFSFGACPRHGIGLDGRNPYPCGLAGDWLADPDIRWWQRLIDLPARWDRHRRIESFSQGCSRLFERHPPRGADVLMLPSVSDFEFLCATRFWRDHDWTRTFDWHLLFHFNFLSGRDPEFASQIDQLRRFQLFFRETVDQIPEHRLHFYATTEAVARQFDALGIAIFHPLPYPTRVLRNSSLDGSGAEGGTIASEPVRRPLRVTLAGSMRREKGKKRLNQLIDGAWDDLLEPGHLRFVLQGTVAQVRQRLPKRLRNAIRVPVLGSETDGDPFVAAPHPLDAGRYDDLIRQSDIGLLVYDGRRYFSRASGVLCEMLSAGVPVIVPAGGWLADQIAEENYRHFDSLWRVQRRDGQPIDVAIQSQQALPYAAPCWLLRFAGQLTVPPGVYVKLSVTGWTNGRDSVEPVVHVLGARDSGNVGVVLRFNQPVTKLSVDVQNAFDTAPVECARFQLLPASADRSARLPLARIGLTFSSESELPGLLAELNEFFPHYRSHARQFAGYWQGLHAPGVTISELESRTRAAGSAGFRAA